MYYKPSFKIEKAEILHRFYEIFIYDDDGAIVPLTDELENAILYPYNENYSKTLDGLEIDNRDTEEINIDEGVDISALNKYFEKYKDAKDKQGKPFDKIVLNWYEYNDGYKSYFRIEGVTKETDEEFQVRIKEWEDRQIEKKKKKELRDKKKEEEKKKKEKILAKLSDEEKKALGLK